MGQTFAEYILLENEELQNMKNELENRKQQFLKRKHYTMADSMYLSDTIKLEYEIREKESYIKGLNDAKTFM